MKRECVKISADQISDIQEDEDSTYKLVDHDIEKVNTEKCSATHRFVIQRISDGKFFAGTWISWAQENEVNGPWEEVFERITEVPVYDAHEVEESGSEDVRAFIRKEAGYDVYNDADFVPMMNVITLEKMIQRYSDQQLKKVIAADVITADLLRLLLDFRQNKDVLMGTVNDIREWLISRGYRIKSTV